MHLSALAGILAWLTLVSVSIFFNYRSDTSAPKSSRRAFAALLIFTPFVSLYSLVSDGFVRSRFGIGPDSTQNIMATIRFRESNPTFDQAKIELLNSLSSSGNPFRELNTLENVRDQAFYDYVVTGFRYASTSIASLLLNLIPNNNPLMLQAAFLFLIQVLFCLAILYILIDSRKSPVLGVILILGLPLNPMYLNQFFNGAWAQSISLPFVLILSYLALRSRGHRTGSYASNVLSSIFASLSFVLAILIYLESLVIVVPLFFIYLFSQALYAVKHFRVRKTVFGFLLIFIPFILFIPFLGALRLKSSLGFSGYGSTGVSFDGYVTPIDFVASFRMDPNWLFTNDMTSSFILLILSAVILGVYVFQIKHKASLISVSSNQVIRLGLAFGLIFSPLLASLNFISNYMSLKLSSFLLVIMFSTFFLGEETSSIPFSLKSHQTFLQAIVALALSINSALGLNSLASAGSSWPASDYAQINSAAIQKELSSYPYITTYIGSATFFGLFGDFNWVSNYPNKVETSLRFDSSKTIRGICFKSDPNCNVPGNKILISPLDSLGLKVWETELTVGEFLSLPRNSRFEFVFRETGQQPFPVG